MNELAFIFSGFFVGFVVGLTGVGGGSLMTPILIFFFNIKPHLAIGTDLLFAAFTKMGGSVKLAQARVIDWGVVGLMAAGSIPASLITLYVLDQAGATNPVVQKAMTTMLGVALLLTAGATLYKAVLGKAVARDIHPDNIKAATKPKHWSLPVLFGVLIGALVTLTSVGAGAIGVTVLLLLYPALPLQRIVAADIAHAVPLTLVAGLGHASIGSVDWSLLTLLLAGSLPGIWIGSHLMMKTPDRLIRGVLAVLLALAGLKLMAL